MTSPPRGLRTIATAIAFGLAGSVGCMVLVACDGSYGESSDGGSDSSSSDAIADGEVGSPLDGASDGGGDGTVDIDGGAGTNPPCETDSELKLCLRFEDNVADEGVNKLMPATQGNLSYEPGRHGKGLRFKVAAPATELTYSNTNFNLAKTIELWIKPMSSARMLVVDVLDDFSLIVEAGTLRCRQPELTATVNLTMNEWNHVACTTDHTTLRAYVNGEPAGTLASTNMADNNGYTGIGQDSTTGANRLEGVIDDLRIWTSTRTAQQIKESASR